MTRVLPVLALVACTSDQTWQGGTGVGNPGSTTVSVARAEGVTVTTAVGVLATLEVELCNGQVWPTRVDAWVDLLGTPPYRVSGGGWCALVARFDPPIGVEGIGGDGGDPDKGTFALSLELEEVRVDLDERFVVDDDALVLELGHKKWVEKGKHLDGLPDGEHVVVGPGDPAHDLIVVELAEGSALYHDANGDGVLDDAERDDGRLGSGPEWYGD